jgi:hypothetical protein
MIQRRVPALVAKAALEPSLRAAATGTDCASRHIRAMVCVARLGSSGYKGFFNWRALAAQGE